MKVWIDKELRNCKVYIQGNELECDGYLCLVENDGKEFVSFLFSWNFPRKMRLSKSQLDSVYNYLSEVNNLGLDKYLNKDNMILVYDGEFSPSQT